MSQQEDRDEDALLDDVSDIETRSLSTRTKSIVSAVIVFHLLAVFMPPLLFQTRSMVLGGSPLIRSASRPFLGYGQFLYLDRGYAFFAPDPGPSRVIQVAVVNEDGTISETILPDRERQWPRLLYHRHFMLTEYLSESYVEPGPPEILIETAPEDAEWWRRGRARYEDLRQSMVDHLRGLHPGKEVALRRLVHYIPSREDYEVEPIALNDLRLYEVLLDQATYEVIAEPSTEVIPPPSVEGEPQELPPTTGDPENTPADSEPSEEGVQPGVPEGTQQ
ncbi:MAG: hypothetical protein AAFX06_06305 [Planctomycetota bacterium]